MPRFAEVVGHELGERVTLHGEMERYLESLAETSPRVRLLDQGRSWEGRRLLAAIVTAPENHARLSAIRATAARLADPRAGDEEEASIAGQPVVVWMGGSIHGNELSGSEGLLALLEHLTTRADPATLEVLREVVLIVDPMLNPDGRDAFAVANRRRRGHDPDPDRRDWNNDYTGWEGVGFRTGHYNFDTNRDWFAHTQRESRARVATIVRWHPQVSVDAHEMGSDVEFYFDPADEPYGPFFPEQARRWFERFGAAYAAAFDSAGIEYMTRERYNYFYPGYTTSFSSYQGSVGMLYEQGSSRGPAIERPDGSVRTLTDALGHQYLAAWTALRTAAERREELLRDYREAQRRAVDDPGPGPRRYLVPPSGDPALHEELGGLLLRNGIEVGALRETVRLESLTDRAGRPVGGRSLPAGTWVIEAAQPRSRLVRALLEPHVPISETFLAEARARVERDESPRFYDITAWSLPLLFDLEAFGSTDAGSLPLDPVGVDDIRPPRASRLGGDDEPVAEPPARAEMPRAGYAYLLDGRRAASVAAAYHLAHRGVRTGMLARSSRIEGGDVPAGSVVARVGEAGDGDAVHEAVESVAAAYGLGVRAVDTGLAEPGFPSLGSADVIPIRPPRIALLAEGPVHGYSFGWAWYTLEEQYRIPTTVLRVGSLADTPLEEFDTLVLPDLFSASGLARELGEAGLARLRRWVRDGGSLVAIGAAVEFARDTLGLLDLRSWYETEQGEEERRFAVPGAIVTGRVDTLRWLAAGLPAPELPILVGSSRLLLPPEGPSESGRREVIRYGEREAGLRLSGQLWAESEERLPGALFLYERRVSHGRVIAFAEDPNFRGYWRGANRLFLNAAVVGPSAP